MLINLLFAKSQKLPKLTVIKIQEVESGFSFLEVLVAMLVISNFFLITLQATVLATFSRIQTQEKNQIINWVQQDLELITFAAFKLDQDTTDIDGDGNTTEYITQTSPPVTTNCTQYGKHLQNTISSNHLASATVIIDGKNYDVIRSYVSTNGGVETNYLQISYTVSYASSHPRYKISGDNTVTTLATEVKPNASFSCP
jgi:competence protein ComGC